jgi:hypothetical protein
MAIVSKLFLKQLKDSLWYDSKHTTPKTSYDLKEPPFLTSVHDKLHKVGHADSNKKNVVVTDHTHISYLALMNSVHHMFCR